MTTITDIGTLINHNPEIHGGCPIIADISEKECRDVAVLRLYKGFG